MSMTRIRSSLTAGKVLRDTAKFGYPVPSHARVIPAFVRAHAYVRVNTRRERTFPALGRRWTS